MDSVEFYGEWIDIEVVSTDNTGKGAGSTTYTYGVFGQDDGVKVNKTEDPASSGFWNFEHTKNGSSGLPFKVEKVICGELTDGLGINNTDILHLAVGYWKETVATMHNPSLIEIRDTNGDYDYYSSKNGINWQPLSGNGGSLLSGEDLEIQLDDLNCQYHKLVTMDLTKSHSEKHTSGENGTQYCCKEYNSKVQVSELTISCKLQHNPNHVTAYKHSIVRTSKLAGIKYYDGGLNTNALRKRITAPELNFPIKGPVDIYTFYCKEEAPVLVYIDSPRNDAAKECIAPATTPSGAVEDLGETVLKTVSPLIKIGLTESAIVTLLRWFATEKLLQTGAALTDSDTVKDANDDKEDEAKPKVRVPGEDKDVAKPEVSHAPQYPPEETLVPPDEAATYSRTTTAGSGKQVGKYCNEYGCKSGGCQCGSRGGPCKPNLCTSTNCQCCKEREGLIWAIRKVVIPFGKSIILVDFKSLRMISSCCSISDLMDEGVELVELITKKRQSIRNRNAICILSDDPSSLDLLCEDFVPGKEKYKALFIIFNYHLQDDSALRQIAECIDIDIVLGCVELHLNFCSYEDRIFHGLMGNTLTRVYPQFQRSIVYPISSRIASFLSTMNARPKIRFYRSKSGICESVAKTVAAFLDIFGKVKDDKDSENGGVNKNSGDVLYILDRSFDFTSLFIHEYTYQAFVYDMLGVPVCSEASEGVTDDTWEFKFVTNAGKKETKVALLNSQNDVLWEKYRHLHIQKVNSDVLDQIKKLSMDTKMPGKQKTISNPPSITSMTSIPTSKQGSIPASQLSLKQMTSIGTVHSSPSIHTDLGSGRPFETQHSKVADIYGTLEIVRNIPQMQYLLEKYWAHVSISERCFEVVQSKDLLKIGAVEQNIATNVDKHGKHISHSKVHQQIFQLFLDTSMDEEDRLRLLILYITSYKNVEKKNIEKLLEVSSISIDGRRVIEDIVNLFSITFTEGSDSKTSHRYDSEKFYKKYASAAEFDLSRYVPYLHHILDKIIKGKVDPELFPYLDSSQETTKEAKEDEVEKEQWTFFEKEEVSKPKVILYIIGGITFSEMREIYAATNRSDFDFYLGGDHITTPSRLIGGFYHRRVSI
ncbi:Sec1 family member protein [Theileria equi strain WA]|uniref:Sec1 family member protein n=1 Tax=Theileria equi strain WA TaxID=1537102 RepID=L1LAP7_THEEQ|nr:Sec1 family member protein [Theileria equi strain WA]EKX72228.1 Sec1 family member protein [Theileria equi strain WA]|eukprot:XP_004831680.1 Sec1 family member protein [Theileria equi strain WA]